MSTNRRKRIGIYPGSFNPVHNGHISLTKYLLDSDIVDDVWIVVSPLNPLKTTSDELIADELRLQMAKIAFEGIRDTKVSDVEFRLSRPSYTIDTLNYLQKQYPDYQFFLLIGEDNMAFFDKKGKNYSVKKGLKVTLLLANGHFKMTLNSKSSIAGIVKVNKKSFNDIAKQNFTVTKKNGIYIMKEE